jgi:hypothetical protein
MKLFVLLPFTAWFSIVTCRSKNIGDTCPQPRSGLSVSGLSAIVESPTRNILIVGSEERNPHITTALIKRAVEEEDNLFELRCFICYIA